MTSTLDVDDIGVESLAGLVEADPGLALQLTLHCGFQGKSGGSHLLQAPPETLPKLFI